jgi:hypothetical protein
MRIDVLTGKAGVLFQYIVIVYFFVGLFYFLSLPTGGDEFLFVSDLLLIKNVGWQEAIVKNISIPYMLLAYPMSLIMEGFIALRMVNIVLFFGLLGYFYFGSKIQSRTLYFYIFFLSSTVGYFYLATNDSLFFVALVIFFNEVHRALNNKNVNFNLALTALIIAFFTRELFLVYLPIIVLGLYILIKSGYKFNTKSLLPLGIFILFLILNIPSIAQSGRLSFDKKSPPKELGVSWSQRQYLAQLMVNNGELENRKHPSWEQTKAYLEKNGKESLPDGVLEGITHSWQLTIKEYFKDFGYSFVYSFRSMGLMLLISIGYWMWQLNRKKKIEIRHFVPFSTLLMLMIFSFIIISYVELRWLIPVFLITLVYYSELEEQNEISKYLIFTNYFVLCLFCIYGMFRIFHKM